jgi:hypothetical protein
MKSETLIEHPLPVGLLADSFVPQEKKKLAVHLFLKLVSGRLRRMNGVRLMEQVQRVELAEWDPAV